jgi:hypothetical protein
MLHLVGFFFINPNSVELHLSGLIGMVSHLDMYKIQITGFPLENRLYWQSDVQLLVFSLCTCIYTF